MTKNTCEYVASVFAFSSCASQAQVGVLNHLQGGVKALPKAVPVSVLTGV